MTKKDGIQPDKFSLIVKNSQIKRIITIPETKRGIERKIVGGKETYQMAIDAFTTKFQNKEELLDYAVQNNLVSLPNANYADFHISIEYRGKGEFNGNQQVLYSDQEDLIDFIDHNEIKEYFALGTPYTNEFQSEIVRNWTAGMFQAEYRIFMTDYKNRYFGQDLIKTLNRLKKENLMNSVKAKETFIEAVSHYHNLRGYFMTKNKLEDILYKITREQIWSPQERIEYEREERMEEMHDSSIPSINLDIIKLSDKKAKKAKKQLPNQQALFDDSLFFNIDGTPKTR